MTTMFKPSVQRQLGWKFMIRLSQKSRSQFSFSMKPSCYFSTLINTHFHQGDWSTTKPISYSNTINFSTNATNVRKGAAVEEGPLSSMRLIPTRHSKHHIPPIAPVDVLNNATDEILKSIPGTLFAYDSNNIKLPKQEEYEIGLSTAHHHQEHIEYLLRGYSSLLQNSLVQLQLPKDPNHPLKKLNDSNTVKIGSSNIANASNMDQIGIIDKMIHLVQRLEKEGDVYVELRSKLRSQIATIYHNENSTNAAQDKSTTPSSDNDDIDASNDATERTKEKWLTNQFTSTYGATPGPSAAMYDLTLDAIANVISNISNPTPYLYKARELFLSSLGRNELDEKQKFDTINLKSIPTAATFNAFIRISASVDSSKTGDEEIRDAAITNGFMAFNLAYHHNIVERNSATYNYLIQTVNKFFPDCERKGYILVALWDKCTLSEGVLDENIIKSMLEVNSEGCGHRFHEYVTKGIRNVYDKQNNGFGFPLKYSKNKNLRRFDKRLDVY